MTRALFGATPPLSAGQGELLIVARRMKLSERAYSATMVDLFRRYNHPEILPRLVLDLQWAMLAAEQNGNVIE